MCYCRDCQSFPRHLGQAERHLDQDGTRIFQTTPDNVAFLKGQENLSLLRLSPKGTFRWYCRCCNTPIANTMANTHIPFCGMVLPKDHPDFGAVKSRFYTKHTNTAQRDESVAPAILATIARAITARITGAERRAPFFKENDQPVAEATVLTLEERKRAQRRHVS